MSCSEDSGSESSSEWEDDEVAENVCICLFCPLKLTLAEDVFRHCAEVHEVDIRLIRVKLGLSVSPMKQR